jgi:putative endonuclease
MVAKNSKKKLSGQFWYVYILNCRDRTLYTGATNNLRARLDKHNNGTGAKYTRGRRPVKLIYSEQFNTRRQALRREAEIKKWPRRRKQELIGKAT